jgi:hypothetical protein
MRSKQVNEAESKPKMIAVGIRLDPDVARFARIHRALTGESVTMYVNRLLRQEMTAQNQRPPAA